MIKTIIFVMSLLILITSPVLANELLVLSGKKSQNSKRWKEEVFPEYSSTKTGKSLPVKIILVEGRSFPGWFNEAIENGQIGEIIGTPTFLIWDALNKKELGRIEGYTQKAIFYSKLREAVTMVDKGLNPGRREGSGGHIREEGSGGMSKEVPGGGSKREGSSSGVMEHQYKTPEEARRASKMLGLGGEIHSHKTPQGTIYMPGSTM